MGAPKGNKNAAGPHKGGGKRKIGKGRRRYSAKNFVGGKKSADSAREFFSYMNRRQRGM